MSSVDLHPEDLLERDAAGELSPSEKERLSRHLRQCQVCRLERRARVAIQRECERIDEDLIVRRALSKLAHPGSFERKADVPKRPSLRGLRPLLVAVAVAIMTATSVAAMRFSALRTGSSWRPAPIQTSESAPAVRSGAGAPSAIPPADPTQTLGPTLSVAPSLSTPRSSATRSIPTHSQLDAAAVFQRANDARRSGDRAHAVELYRLLVDSYPLSSEAHHAQAVLGQMMLDSGDLDAALRYFDEYLHTGGALSEDVMLDRAASLQRLGRPDDEAAAWASLLQAYPGSVHAERAHRRLSELGKR
jgi:TolA-binding protein